MIHQLRIYEINPELKNEFDIRFRKHASRIMASYGFNIVSMWYSESQDKSEFIYILEWDNIDVLNQQWRLFMTDNEWANIKTKSRDQYGEMVLGKSRDQILEDTRWFKNKI